MVQCGEESSKMLADHVNGLFFSCLSLETNIWKERETTKTLTKKTQEMLTSNGMRNPSLLYWGASCVVENVKAFDQNVSWLLRDSADVNVFY